MANTKSAEKRIRTNIRKHQRNQMVRSNVKTMIKKADKAICQQEAEPAAIYAAIVALDKAAGKGIIHKNNAARRKSRLIKRYQAAQTAHAAE